MLFSRGLARDVTGHAGGDGSRFHTNACDNNHRVTCVTQATPGRRSFRAALRGKDRVDFAGRNHQLTVNAHPNHLCRSAD